MNTKPTEVLQEMDEIDDEAKKHYKEIEGFIRTGYDDTYIVDSIMSRYPNADQATLTMRCSIIRMVMAHNPDWQ